MGPRLKAGKKVRAPTITMVAMSKPLNSPPVTGNVPADSGTTRFFCQAPGDSQHRNDHEKAAEAVGRLRAGVVPRGVRIQTVEC